jgi:hypothetical protein
LRKAWLAGAVALVSIGAVEEARAQPPTPPSTDNHAPPPIGISISWVSQQMSGDGGLMGPAVTPQWRPSAHTVILLDLQALGGRVISAEEKLILSDYYGLLGARLFPWNAPLAPYFEAAAGFGQKMFQDCCGPPRPLSYVLGRYALGVEWRLPPAYIIELQVGHLHRLPFERDDGLAPRSGRSLELRLGVGCRL